jgi:serine/threonine protein kinase
MRAALIVDIGRQSGIRFDLPGPGDEEKRVLLGRAPVCEIRLHDSELSRRHCEFTFQDGRYYVEDLKSHNGTRVNGKKIRKKTELKVGDQIDVGMTRLLVDIRQERMRTAPGAAAPKSRGSVLKPLSQSLTRESLLQSAGVDRESDPHIGSLFAGTYQILERLERTEKSVVYKAQDATTGDVAALKIIRPGVALTENEKARFIRGAREAAKLRCRNIVRILRGGSEHGLLYLAMELVEGQSLGNIIEENPYGLDVKVCVDLGLQLCTVVEALTQAGLVHRKICPDNILLGSDGVLRITDFSLLRSYVENGRSGEGDVTPPTERDLSSEPFHAAPELITRNRPADPRTDIYAVGAVLYHASTGVAPYGDVSEREVLSRILNNELLGPEKLKPTIPANFSRIVMRAMAADPASRYQSASEFSAALAALKSELSTMEP